MKYITGYDRIEERGGEYFIGMNTGRGFVGTYRDIINEKNLQRLYIIKGAAGTGKSTLMRNISKAAENNGNLVVRYLCSSDPSSFDCILIDDKIAVTDGTPPHAVEMEYPGAASEIINMTEFWDKEKLILEKDKISEICENKKKYFQNAYTSLKALEVLSGERKKAIYKAIDSTKMVSAAERIVKSFGKSTGNGSINQETVKAISMNGNCSLSTFSDSAKQIIKITDYYGSGYAFMDALEDLLVKSGWDILESRDPVNTDNISDIFVKGSDILFTFDDTEVYDRTVNMSRFILNDEIREIKGGIRLSVKCSLSIMEDVKKNMYQAGKYHFELENKYISAMNFKSLNEYSKVIISEILNRLH